MDRQELIRIINFHYGTDAREDTSEDKQDCRTELFAIALAINDCANALWSLGEAKKNETNNDG